MLNTILRHYFTNKDYGLLYLHNAFKTVSFMTMGVFISGWLYKIGLDLHWIVLYQAANFTIMGLLSPIGAYITNKHGITVSFALSFISYFISLLALAAAEDSAIFILIGLVFSGIANGLQNPTDMMFHAAYIHNENRGKAISIVNIISTLTGVSSFLVSGWMIESAGLWGVSFVCAVFWIFSLLCVAKMKDLFQHSEELDISRCYKEVFVPQNRNLLFLGLGFQFLIIASFTFIPLILYLRTENFQVVSVIAAIAVLLQLAIITAQGIWVDKTKSTAPLRFAIAIHSVGLIIYCLPFVTKLGLFAGDALQRTGLMLFFGSLFPRIHEHAVNNKIPLLSFGAIFHMCICFWELVVLSLMAITIFFYGETALLFCLGVCAVGSFLAYIYCHKYIEDK